MKAEPPSEAPRRLTLFSAMVTHFVNRMFKNVLSGLKEAVMACRHVQTNSQVGPLFP